MFGVGSPENTTVPRLTAHRIVLVVGAVAIALHAFVVLERRHEISYDGVELFILAATVWGIRRHRPSPARPWWLLAFGLGLLVVGDVIFNALTRIHGEEVFPSAADALYLASYAVLSWGLIAVLHARRHQRDRTALLDAGLVTVVAAVGTWVYLVDPTAYGGVPLLEAVISAAYPVATSSSSRSWPASSCRPAGGPRPSACSPSASASCSWPTSPTPAWP